jgi:hypothetical protein
MRNQIMQKFAEKRASLSSFAAVLTVLSVIAPTIAGCSPGGGSQSASGPAPGGAPAGSMQRAPMSAPPKQGMSTGKKVAILAGTAALIYLYNKQKNAKGTGKEGQYYRSKSNGRIYYRDEKGNAVYVTPPAGGIQVPAEQAEIYNNAARTGTYDLPQSSFPSGPRGAVPTRSY